MKPSLSPFSSSSATPPECAAMPAGALIDVAQYLDSLQYSALVGMYKLVHYSKCLTLQNGSTVTISEVAVTIGDPSLYIQGVRT